MPHTDGNSVYSARALYNCKLAAEGDYYAFNDDCNPSGLYRTLPLVKGQTAYTVNIYPNPTKSGFFLKTNGKADETIEIVISDLTGKQIKSFQKQLLNNEIYINEYLIPSFYLIIIKNANNEEIIKKLIVD
jgi:Secretion system C-terminal sorting domain